MFFKCLSKYVIEIYQSIFKAYTFTLVQGIILLGICFQHPVLEPFISKIKRVDSNLDIISIYVYPDLGFLMLQTRYCYQIFMLSRKSSPLYLIDCISKTIYIGFIGTSKHMSSNLLDIRR